MRLDGRAKEPDEARTLHREARGASYAAGFSRSHNPANYTSPNLRHHACNRNPITPPLGLQRNMGHPDYARPDIMGEVVNIAFLTLNWAETHTQSGLASTALLTDHLDDAVAIVQTVRENFKDIDHPVEVCELRQRDS